MSLLFLPLTFRHSFVRSSRRVVVLLPPLPLRYLSSSCFAFGVRYFVYFLFYFICLIASLVVQMFGAGAIRDGRVSSLK